MDKDKLKILALAKKKLDLIKLSQCFDPYDPSATPTAEQQRFFGDISVYKHRYCVGGNQSGKTASGAWECQKIFQNKHEDFPKIDDKPRILLIIARTSKHYTSIWEDKIVPFLPEGSFKPFITAGVLSHVKHKENGNKIYFFSHNNPENAREKVQYFAADWVWLDEMPNSFNLVEELHRRAMSREGASFIATFTPKIINEQIRKLVDSENQYQQKYIFKTLDNPIFKGREEEILAPMETMSDDYKQTVLEGAWYSGDSAVYQLRPDKDICNPPSYSPSWRHLESIDPAARGIAGLVVFAEDPSSGIWYIIKSEYLKGGPALELIDKIKPHTNGLNIVKRICDPHEVWFMAEASKHNRVYGGVFSKNNRKIELIKNLQKALLEERLKISDWCTDLIDEFNSCQWSETHKDKIVGASKFHLLDAAQYGLDRLPKKEHIPQIQTHDQLLYRADVERRKKAVAAEKSRKDRYLKRNRAWGRRRRIRVGF